MKYPFKFLDSYDKADSDIFFGRDTEIEDLYKMTTENNVVWLYGPSGTGKTSLVQCGLARKFRSYEWSDIRVPRGNSTITKSLEAALDQAMGTEISVNEEMDKLFQEAVKSPATETTREVTPIEKKIQAIYLQYFRPIYLIFDQFEELFILGSTVEYDEFEVTLKNLLQTQYPLKIIFVIREDYLGYLYELEKSIPGLMKKKLRIAPVDLEKTIEILTKIGESDASLIKLEQGKEKEVVGKIFHKAKEKENSSTIQLPYLQIFLDKLYLNITNDEKRGSSAVFTEDSLKTIGNIDSVLRDFLEDQVVAIADTLKKTDPSISTTTIWSILSPFVSLEKTKKPISREDLHTRLKNDLKKQTIDSILDLLEDKRIIRHVPETGLFELAHDSLAERVIVNRNTHEKNLLEKSNLISNRFTLYQANKNSRNLFLEDELKEIGPLLEELEAKKMITKDAKDLIEHSRKHIEKEKEAELQRRINEAKKDEEKRLFALEQQLKEAETQKKTIELLQRNKEIEFLKRQTEIQAEQLLLEARVLRLRSRRSRNIFLALAALVGIIFLAFFITSTKTKRAYRISEENRYWLIANLLRRSDNLTLSYIALQEGLEKNKNSDTLNRQKAELQKSNFFYLQGVYPSALTVRNVTLKKDSIIIYGSTAKTIWITSNRTFLNSIPDTAEDDDKIIETEKGAMSITGTAEYLEIRDSTRSVIARIPDEDYLNTDATIISDDGRFLLIDHSKLYDLQGNSRTNVLRPLKTVPKYIIDDAEKNEPIRGTASVFLNKGRVAVGYENGDVLVYSYSTPKKNWDTLGIFSSFDEFYSEKNNILGLTADRKYKTLFVKAQNGFGVCNLKPLDSTQARRGAPNDKSDFLESISSEIKELKDGHTGLVSCLSFSVNDSLMLSGSTDNTAILWDISSKDIKKIATFKGPNSSEIIWAGFSDDNKDIITVSGGGIGTNAVSKTYLWKRGWPSDDKKGQVYRFSPFDLQAWGLTADTSFADKTTRDLYRYTLDYYLNLPVTNKFPNEGSYTQTWQRSLLHAANAYNTLISRRDYEDTTILKEEAKKILASSRYYYLSPIERDLSKLKDEIKKWKTYLSDSSRKNRSPSTLLSSRFITYTERQDTSYADAAKLLAFYSDSVWKPLVKEFGNDRRLVSLKRNIDVRWCKYYLYTGNHEEALKIARELSKITIGTVNNSIYIVAAYLASGKFNDASSLYKNIQGTMKEIQKKYSDNELFYFLGILRTKGIGVENIDRFIKEFKLD